MPRPPRSATRTAFAIAQLLLLGTAVLGLGSPLEVLLGAIVIALLLLTPELFRAGGIRTGKQPTS